MNLVIGLISPYKELTEEAVSVFYKYFSDYKNKVSFLAHTSVLDDVVSDAKRLEDSGAHVIMIRENTDVYLQGKTDIPIVPIPVSSNDLLRAICEAKAISNNIALAIFRDGYKDIDAIQKILSLPIKQFTFYNLKEAYDGIKNITNKTGVLVGGGLTVRIAKEYGIPSVLITSGEASLYYSLKAALISAKAKWEEQAKVQEISGIVNQLNEGIVATDKNGKILVVNPKAKAILKVQSDELLEEKHDAILEITSLTEAIKNKAVTDVKVVKIHGKDILVSSKPVVVRQELMGAVCTLQEVAKVQELENRIRLNLNIKGHKAKFNFEDIIGKSHKIKSIINTAKKYAKSDFTILITGETGTGKELFVQSIHSYSKRKTAPFVAINCATIFPNLLEAELFGYEEGSFTGAKKGGKNGLFVEAHLGTIFLDEIGELPLHLQSRLLRVIQEKEVIKVGGDRIIPVDVRIIAATNVDLLGKVNNGQFRKDLYHRINVLNLQIPPLRERREDIPLIGSYILGKYNVIDAQSQKNILSAIMYFDEYKWDGNIRELENILARLAVIFRGNTISYQSAFFELQKMLDYYSLKRTINDTTINNTADLTNLIKVRSGEKEVLKELLKNDMNREQMAQILKISRTTLWRKLKKYNLLE